jgi:pimeloyl-ACP methyl ester carboxylesterase
MTAGLDAGLADGYWRQYFTPGEVAELEAAIKPTGVVYGDTPVHVRVYDHGPDAPTIVAPHGLIVYGFLCARLHLEFFRAGWNVVSWDFPGFGQSGGPRNGPTIGKMIDVWRLMIDWASAQYRGRPVYVVGLAEDGITGYYAAANNPNVEAISAHHLVEFGDLDNVAWVNPRWWRWVQGKGLAVLEKVAPWVQFNAEKAVPWEAIFSSEEDQAAYALYRNDPLRIQRYNVHLARDLFRPRRPPVPFEECRTPVQIISSELNKIWPAGINDKTYARLGCEKEHVRLEGLDQWSVAQGFNAIYAGHVMRWFERFGDRAARADAAEALA